MTALDSNVRDLVRLFPLAVFQLDKGTCPPLINISCPSSMKSKVVNEVQQKVQALQTAQCSLPFQPSQQDLQPASKVPLAVQQLIQQLQGQCLLVEYNAASAQVVITTFQNVLASVEQRARAWLGLATPAAAAPKLSVKTASHQEQVMALLQVSL